jgi:hypothetical protein
MMLRRVRNFGYKNPGYGFSCAEMASEALGMKRRRQNGTVYNRRVVNDTSAAR